MTATSHWAVEYIGLPYAPPERDCWGFFRSLRAERYGDVLPAVPVPDYRLATVISAFREAEERAAWAEVPEPVEGDAVLLGRSKHPAHVGMWVAVGGGGVLHCERGCGVVFSDRAALAKAGWSLVRYYRRLSCAPN